MAKDDLSPRQGPIQPASIRLAGPDATTPGAAEVVQSRADDINAFVSTQRQRVGASVIDQHKATYVSDDLDIVYRNLYGHEIIELYPRVTPPPTIELQAETPPGIEPVPFEPVFPTFDYPVLCMLVLYKGDRLAAIPMGGLYGTKPAFPVIYSTEDQGSSFTQPVLVGQANFGGVDFIVTDVDLSGKKLAASTICTTRMNDAISLGQKVVPIMASDHPVSDTAPKPEDQIVVYTSACAVTYSRSEETKFRITAKNVNSDQVQAIDPADGTLYYGASWDAGDLTMTVDKSTVTDTPTKEKAISDATVKASSYVPFYTLNYVIVHDILFHHTFDSTQEPKQWDDNGLTYYTFPGTDTTSELQTDHITLTVVSNVVENHENKDIGKDNLNDITEVLGTSYYGRSSYTSPVSLQNIKLATVDIPYFEWVQSDNFYEYMEPNRQQIDFSNDLVRMKFSADGNLTITTDRVVATSTSDKVVTTKEVQHYPSWGGDLIGGYTDFTDNSSGYDFVGPSPGNGQPGFHYVRDLHSGYGYKQISGHTTLDSALPSGSYEQGQAQAADIVAKITAATPGDNGQPGAVNTYGSDAMTKSTTTYTTVDYIDGAHRHNVMNQEPTPYTYDTQQSDDMGIPAPPGYKAQLVAESYRASLVWAGNTIASQSDDSGGPSGEGSIIFSAFPPGTAETGYATVATKSPTDVAQRTYVVTPYKLFSTAGIAAGKLTGWMHVSTPGAILQGFIIGTTPYIYLNKVDVTAQLAAALGCKPTDIAACYFNIFLDDIKLLANVR